MNYGANGYDYLCHEMSLPKNVEECPESSDDEEIDNQAKSRSTIV